MKNYLNIIAIALLLITGAQSQAQSTKKNQKAVIKTRIYCDHCRECETCGQNFQIGLMKVDGLRMFELDEKNMTITVYYNARKTDLATIKKAIANLGYDADELSANPEAYEKLDNCCKV